MIKCCSKCKNKKLLSEFWNNKSQRDGKDNLCIACRKAKSIDYKNKNKASNKAYERKYKSQHSFKLRKRCKKYGIKPEDFEAMFKKQGGTCKLCTSTTNLHIDHCHKTGVVRGLLCHQCNLMLGAARDSTLILSKAIAYLSEQTV